MERKKGTNLPPKLQVFSRFLLHSRSFLFLVRFCSCRPLFLFLPNPKKRKTTRLWKNCAISVMCGRWPSYEENHCDSASRANRYRPTAVLLQQIPKRHPDSSTTECAALRLWPPQQFGAAFVVAKSEGNSWETRSQCQVYPRKKVRRTGSTKRRTISRIS